VPQASALLYNGDLKKASYYQNRLPRANVNWKSLHEKMYSTASKVKTNLYSNCTASKVKTNATVKPLTHSHADQPVVWCSALQSVYTVHPRVHQNMRGVNH